MFEFDRKVNLFMSKGLLKVFFNLMEKHLNDEKLDDDTALVIQVGVKACSPSEILIDFPKA